MTIRVGLSHVTTYRYDRPVALSPHLVRLRPAPHCRTPVTAYSLRVAPEPHFINWQQDPYGNHLARLVFPEPTRELRVEVDLIAELTVINPFDFFLDAATEHWPFAYEADLARDLAPFLATGPAGPLLARLVAAVPRTPRPTTPFLVELNQLVATRVGYVIRLEPGVQTAEETLTTGTGSCRDSAWLLVQVARHLGLAARFASGYLIQLTSDEPALDGPSGPERDFTDLHAWAEIYVPGAGWIGLDATSGLFAGEGHIPLACTPEPQSAAPVAGGFTVVTGADDEAETAFAVTMRVIRVHEDPRTTKPYTDEQWTAVNHLGADVDAALTRGDVRLTMGGEPTFVALADRDAPEWNTAALGGCKRGLGVALVGRLRDRFAPGALLHVGQGKWYPGEPLPRWALTCWWRVDGHPIWRDPARFADEGDPPGHGVSDALRLGGALARRLGVDPCWLIPGYEDAWYYLWRERRLPIDVDPHQSRLADPLERARLSRLFERGLDAAVGYALPLRARDGLWQSGPWTLRPGKLFLLPGDSPMGLRLPLDSLPMEGADEVPEPVPDPFAPRPPLRVAGAPRAAPPPPRAPSGPTARTALCVEARGGILHVFLPPLTLLEDYLAVVEAIEDAAADTGLSVLVEGYPPPRDARLRQLAVTPDPGVIEVNVHPARDWGELCAITSGVYAEARACRLGAEKFLLDGRHTGTGGGNHVTLGGETAADSPFLRRPDLLRSLVAYWHNHPALSYLFSGLFVGAFSQAPRPDEARVETTAELDLALSRLPTGQGSPPWLIDRALRHLLIDLTGNTHRAQISIDKLFSPDSASGRLGLVELRCMEMPPHERMSLVQQLLVRALVARFWAAPYHERLVRWGIDLQDRWMLPRFLEQDLGDVLADCARAGFAFAPAWFAPHLDFRFPLIGSVVHRGVQLELRTALEPWHILGEEATSGGTARYVDSSLERLQVRVIGATPGRHAVTCNGIELPLRPTGTTSELVCGVRYRAWQPPSCLHPTIPVDVPLVFDLVDRWNDRAVAGCTYHVAHPAGRTYERLPINANEAEARRAARFQAEGHTPGIWAPRAAPRNDETPFTLDLRLVRR